MDLYEALFILSFLAALFLLGLKLWNVLNAGIKYEFPGVIISFVGYLVAWVVCLIVMLQDPEELVYVSLQYLLNWCIIVNVMLTIVEVILNLKRNVEDKTIRPFSSQVESFSKAHSFKRM